MKITKRMTEAAYGLSADVYHKRISRKFALDQLENTFGMTRGTAADYLVNFKKMVEGEKYVRTNNAEATEYFFTKILQDYGEEKLSNAIKAASEHVDYYESLDRGNLNGIRAIISRHEKILKHQSRIDGSDEVTITNSASFVFRLHGYLKKAANLNDWHPTGKDRVFRMDSKAINDMLTRPFEINANFWVEEPKGSRATLKFEFTNGKNHEELRVSLASSFRKFIRERSFGSLSNIYDCAGSSVIKIFLEHKSKNCIIDEPELQQKAVSFYHLVNDNLTDWRYRALPNLLNHYCPGETNGSETLFHSTIDDLGVAPLGSATPDRSSAVVSKFKRDPSVRKFVKSRASGACEYCGVKGFLTRDNFPYLEAHHIISLANEGPDTYDNVIALCPNHHRQAHYGLDSDILEKEMIEKIYLFSRERKTR